MIYSNSLQIKDALQLYFSKYHFANGGYNLKWFKIKLGKIFIPMPNIKARVDAVKIHDIHHLITEYNADYQGEAEIGGWEIASGCGKYWVAWILNLGSILIGMLFYQKHLFKAFMRGRKAKTNLYYNIHYDESLLNKTLGEVRELVDTDSQRANTLKDYALFTTWCLIALIYHLIIVCAFIYAFCKVCGL